MTTPTALISIASLRDLITLNFSVFCELFLKMRKFCQPWDNCGKKNDNVVYRCDNFLLRGWLPSYSMACVVFYTMSVKLKLLHCHYK